MDKVGSRPDQGLGVGGCAQRRPGKQALSSWGRNSAEGNWDALNLVNPPASTSKEGVHGSAVTMVSWVPGYTATASTLESLIRRKINNSGGERWLYEEAVGSYF